MFDPITAHHDKATKEKILLEMVSVNRYVSGVQVIARKVLEVHSNERLESDSFHRMMTKLSPEALYSQPKFFKEAPPLYRAYFPLTLLWKFARREMIDPKVISLLEEEISSVFIPKDELMWFTHFVHADLVKWGIILSRLFDKAHYSHVSPNAVWIFENVLQNDFFITGCYLSFMARHIRDGSFPHSYGSGAQGLLNWLIDLQSRHTPSHFEKIISAFPFAEHFDCCNEMLQSDPSSENSRLALACLQTVFNISSERHWDYLQKLGKCWLDSPFNSFLIFIGELREQITIDPAVERLNSLIAEFFLVALQDGKGHFVSLLQFKPINKEQSEVRRLLLREVTKQLSNIDPVFIKNLFLNLIDYPDFPLFWIQFPLRNLSHEDLHQLLLAVEKIWPDLSLSLDCQHFYQFYTITYLNPTPSQQARMAHFFPNFCTMPPIAQFDLFFTRQGDEALLALYWTTESSAHLEKIVTQKVKLLQRLESKIKITPCLKNWTHILAGLKILDKFPLKTKFSTDEQENFEKALSYSLRSVPQWINTSNHLSFEFLKALSLVAKRYPILFSKQLDLTLTLEASLAYAVTKELQLEVLEALGRFYKLPMIIHSSKKIQTELDAIQKSLWSSSHRGVVTLAWMTLQHVKFPLETGSSQITKFLTAREIGKVN